MKKFQKILKKLGLVFVEETHKYLIADREIPSATTIINEVMGNTFAKDTLWMIVARDKGTVIHQVISEFVLENKEPELKYPEFRNFLKLSLQKDIVWDLSEQIIYNKIDNIEYAGTLDLYCSDKKEITDIKTGSTKQIKKWQMQLSLYAWALRDTFKIKVERASILWLHKDKGEYIEIEILSKADIFVLLKQYYVEHINK